MKIKLGFIGLGQRGNGLLTTVLSIYKNVEVVAVCDVYQDRVEEIAKRVKDEGGMTVTKYTDYRDLLKDENVNTVIISAAWEAHVKLAVDSMKAGKITGLEVGGAYSIDDCWELVRTYEETHTPFMFLENCCFGEKELVITKMVRQGCFGEICYVHGSYCHDLRKEISGGVKNRHYRLRNYLMRNCDNYPTHQLGPIAKILNINRGNRMTSIVTRASKSRGLHEYAQGKDDLSFLQDKHFSQGDVVQSLVTCADGTMISLKLDTSLPRGYSRELSLSGTLGVYNEQGNVIILDSDVENGDKEVSMNDYINSYQKYKEKYIPDEWKNMTKEEIEAGHGGMDTLSLGAFFKCAENGYEMPIDVYDAASWMCITCLSEASIATGKPMEIPDFTNGKWVMRKQKDVIEF